MIDFDLLTNETFDLAKSTAGIYSSTGLFGYDLTGWVWLSPTMAEFRNEIGRRKSNNGGKFAIWRALTNVNASQPDPNVPFDYAANIANFNEQDMQAPYTPVGMGGRVTQDSIDLAMGLGADPVAVATVGVLNQAFIGEDKVLIGGQQFALATPGTPVVTPVGTGGSIGTVAINVKVAARTGKNYYYGGSTVASAEGTATPGSGTTNSATVTVAAVKGAVAYDWFVGGFYYTTTTTNTLTVTSIPGSAQALPTNLPELSTVAPTTPPVADTSADPNAPNGLIASILGDYNAAGQYVTAGTGTSWGAPWTSLDGGTLTLAGGSISQLDTLFLNLWNATYVSPTVLMMNAQQASDIASKLTASPGAVTFLQPQDANRRDITAGGFVGHIVNKAAGGRLVPVKVYSHVPPGTIIARSDTVPYPEANIDSVHSVRTHRDYARFDYAAARTPGVAGGGPRQDFEVRSIEAYINAAPPVNAILSNIAAG